MTSDDASPTTVPEAPAAGGLALDDIREMLLSLVPEAGEPVRWADVTGAVYEAPPYASARQQFRLLEIVRASLPHVREAVLSFRQGPDGAGFAGLAGLVSIVSDPETLATLERMFAVLHPGAVAKAAKNCGSGGAELQAGDFFAAEEMLRAVLPFSVRPVLSLMDQLAPAGTRMMRAVQSG